WGVIKQLSADEQERAEAEAVEKARRDMVARIRSAEMKGREEGRVEGRQEGRQEGRLEERRAIAANMLADGLSVEQISRFTELSHDEVSAIAGKANN
nr:hypothetical protein [Desulfovibrio sp.]